MNRYQAQRQNATLETIKYVAMLIVIFIGLFNYKEAKSKMRTAPKTTQAAAVETVK